jgi:hypothetical protein
LIVHWYSKLLHRHVVTQKIVLSSSALDWPCQAFREILILNIFF